MRILCSLLLLLGLITQAAAQNTVRQSGVVTGGHGVRWVTDGVIADAGTAANPSITSLGAMPGPICVNSAPITGPYNAFCMQVNSAGALLTLNNINGATGSLTIAVNGVPINPVTFPITKLTSPLTLYVNNSVGVDSTSCGTNLLTFACSTIAQAVANAFNNYVAAGNSITIQLTTTGVSYAPFTAWGSLSGGAILIIQGDASALRDVVIDGGGGGACIDVRSSSTVLIQHLKVQNCATLISSQYGAILQHINIAFGICKTASSGQQQYASHGGAIQAFAPYFIDSSSGCAYHILAINSGEWDTGFLFTGATVATFTANTTFSIFANAESGGRVFFEGYSAAPYNVNGHTTTGFSWGCGSNGLFQTLVPDPDFFPNNAGSHGIIGSCAFNTPMHSSTPSVSGFSGGTGISGNDYAGVIVSGGIADTGGTITFSNRFDNIPTCQLQAIGSPVSVAISARSVTAFTIDHTNTIANFYYTCVGG